jgi:magnesium transporter
LKPGRAFDEHAALRRRSAMAKRKSERKSRHKRKRVGPPVVHAPPGTLTIQPDAHATTVHVIAYGPSGMEEVHACEVTRLHALRSQHAVIWVHVIGLEDAAVIAGIGKEFGMHPLALEDVVHTHQRPKVQRFGSVTQIVVRIVEEPGSPDTEQLSVFVGKGFVVSFEERREDIFDVVRQRIRDRAQRLSDANADFLAYTLLDVAVDAFFPVLETISEELEAIEDEIPEAGPHALTPRLRIVKHQLLGLRRALWPMREVLGALASDPSAVIGDETRMYLRDCQDHCAQLIDIVTTNRELATDLVDLQMSVASQRMNEVMKVLTVMATLFIPLTFICSIYGMNFNTEKSPLNMPELTWYWGYPFALSLMVATAIGLLFFFRRKGWI